ncbi:grpE protein homolog 1, mitochondrial [Centruroides vittatus]|uniref:grpE protein homolog 1, mitochondrial n=1 Tax=Centruroides vittatus TaxID=120091 RepID=UPI0035103B6A
MKKQIEDAKLFGIQKFCTDLLDVADVLSKATESVPKEALKEDNQHLLNLYQGLQMTEAQLQSVFRRHGLTQINPLGEKFDPNLHEAVFQHADPSKEPGTVFVVNKIGYKLMERTIRPASVGIVKAP